MRKVFISLIVFNILLLISCSKRASEEGPPPPNIVLLIPDALRAKQLPCYGYNKIRTPTIDNLGKNGVVFENCLVKQPVTYVSFSNLFGGSWSASTGLLRNEKTLAEYLQETGYYTIGFVSSRVLWSPEHYEKSRIRNEFHRGFDEYIQDASLEDIPYHRKSEDTTKDILKWLDEHKKDKSPFFLFAHYMDPHAPYTPSYDAEIEMIDKEVGKVIGKLKELSLYDNSLIIFTSDHGESLGDPVADHGYPFGHGWFPYREQIRIPLIIKFPHNKYTKVVSQIVRNIDIMPTLLKYLGKTYDKKQIEGEPLLPAIETDKELGLASYHSTVSNRLCPEGTESIVFSDDNSMFQYIRSQYPYPDRIQEFYNITNDPLEQNNLYSDVQYEKILVKAQQLLEKFSKKYDSFHKKELSRGSIELDQKELSVLKTLGYIGGGVPAPDIRRGHFLMSKQLGRIGYLQYDDFIHQNLWGFEVVNDDGYHAIKIVTLDNKEYFIIADKNRELFRYSKEEGFQSLNLNDIQDIALNPRNSALYILQNDKLKIMESKGKIEDIKFSNINTFLPFRGICFDNNNNMYILNKEKLIRFDKDGKPTEFSEISSLNSNKIAIDEEGNIFAAEEDKIIKYNKSGMALKSFGVEDIHHGISSVAIDKANNVWVLESESPSVIIYDGKGNKISSFKYNTNNFSIHSKGIPVPTKQLLIRNNKVYIIDSWENIFVYSLI